MPFRARWSGNNASPSHIICINITCHKTEGSDHIIPVTVKTAPCESVMFSTLWLCLSDRLSHALSVCLSVCPTLICLSLKSFSAQTTPQLCTNHIVQNHNNIFICLFFPSYKNLGATDKLFSNWQRRNTCCSQNSQSGILSPNSLKKMPNQIYAYSSGRYALKIHCILDVQPVYEVRLSTYSRINSYHAETGAPP